ncbi:unnamed protein product [Miscanthus lutarioriparius]|uniref:Cellulose synthase n=1 Tax=Miscanthus lutarioriparius TaxID=422564 RepID=A0A811RRW3_9POAL|nr:unnamed protein product [Miscanthus lutarioriparius]
MAANKGMVAGSHNRNEFVMIRHDGDAPAPAKPAKSANGQVCQICGDTVGVSATGDVFVACNECAFPVCRPCYEYERKEGNQCCPQCKTRYKRQKGSPRVHGDEEEEDVDDLDNEFNNGKGPEWQLQRDDADLSSSARHEPHHRIPRLTSGQQISGEIPDASPDRHSIRSPTSSYVDPSVPDQFPKWYPINRETYLDRLALRYDREGEPSQLAPIDVFVSTVDPLKEPPLITANTVLSILAVDYPVDKVSCYVSDDGSAMLTFESLSETAEFARKWVPFREYEEFKIRINALVAKAQKVPEEGWTMADGTAWPGNNPRDHPGMIQVFLGHSGGLDTDGNELPRLVYVSREKRPGFQHHKKAGSMNALVCFSLHEFTSTPGTLFICSMLIIPLSLVGRFVSAVLTNGAYLLNVDCDHYFNSSKALREAMCFMMDPALGRKTCYVQFPQRFDGIDLHDRYANRNIVFFDINMKGLDGIQGPVYVGTGCCFNRQALYGYDPVLTEADLEPNIVVKSCCGRRKKKNKSYMDSQSQIMKRTESSAPIFNMEDIKRVLKDERSVLISQRKLEKRFGQSPIFIASTFMTQGGIPPSTNPASLLKEAIHVISCGYEDKTEWGKEIGWIYGSVTEDILTGFKMHARGWQSIYCMPPRPCFKGSAPINLSDRLNQVLRWALGSVEILLSRHCPIWYGYNGRLKLLERLAYINTIVYPITSIPLIAYCVLPAICLLTNKFIIPEISNYAGMFFILLFASIFATGILELRWSGVGIEDWWRNEQFWVIGGTSAHLFAVFQGLLKVLAGIDTNFTVTSKASDEDGDFAELYVFKWTSLLIPPTTVLVINLVGMVAGISYAINSGYQSWGPLFGKAVLLDLGDPPSLSLPQGSHGQAEPHTNNRHRLVHPPRVYLLLAVGEDRSFHLPDTESCRLGAMRCELLIETVTLI